MIDLYDIAKLTGVSIRHVRRLVAERFVPRPRGSRCVPEWGEDHIRAVQRYQRLRNAGFPPAAIRVILKGHEGASFPVVPGVSLLIAPELIGKGADVRPVVQQ